MNLDYYDWGEWEPAKKAAVLMMTGIEQLNTQWASIRGENKALGVSKVISCSSWMNEQKEDN